MRVGLALVVVFVWLLGNTVIARAESPPTWAARRLTLSAELGIQAPLGLSGVEAEVSAADWLAVGAGLGTSLSGNIKWERQVAVWVAPRWTFDHSAVGFDVGVSSGAYSEFSMCEVDCGSHVSNRAAVWVNTGLRYQYLDDSGFAFRAFAGAATLANASTGNCDLDTNGSCNLYAIGYGGVAFGYAIRTAGW